MPRVELDNKVFAHLQKHAVPFIETPNDTLRRLLGMDIAENGTSELNKSRVTVARPAARKRAKANLGALISAGMLKNGQKLFLHDYQGNRVRGAEATVGGHGIWPTDRRRLYSMSDLAQELLQKEGYQSDSVRGPSHWRTHDGKSITDLWDEYLATRG
jgi:hypothetical protein